MKSEIQVVGEDLVVEVGDETSGMSGGLTLFQRNAVKGGVGEAVDGTFVETTCLESVTVVVGILWIMLELIKRDFICTMNIEQFPSSGRWIGSRKRRGTEHMSVDHDIVVEVCGTEDILDTLNGLEDDILSGF